MDQRARELVKISDGMFAKKAGINIYHQELAEHFYPERADFTIRHWLGDGNENGNMTSVPELARRELGNIIPSILRPVSAPWNSLVASDTTINERHENRMWMERATKILRRAMYDPIASFVRATRECDHDWVTFGQGVISVEANMTDVALLYRTWHLRDCAWVDGITGKTERLDRKWRPTLRQLYQKFPKTMNARLIERMQKEPEIEVNCLHLVCPRDDYEPETKGRKSPKAKWMSVYIDVENEEILESTPQNWLGYVVPRWSTVSGSQYAWSPATGPGLKDARTLQAVTRTLLEAGEKSVDPPMVATMEAVRSDVDIGAGGITWLDNEYDERTGEALRPMNQNINIPHGIELADRLHSVIDEGMFLNKINLPADMGKMTAYETRKRIEQMVREQAPLFEPASEDYNAPLCELSFEILMSVNTFGPRESIPPDLQNKEIRFEFASPLTDMIDEANTQKFIQGAQILQVATQIDAAQVAAIAIDEAFPDALRGVGFPESWMAPEGAVAAERERQAKAKQAQDGMGALAGGATAAKDAATAAATLQGSGLLG